MARDDQVLTSCDNAHAHTAEQAAEQLTLRSREAERLARFRTIRPVTPRSGSGTVREHDA